MTRRGEVYHAPRECPVCGDDLIVTRLGCPGCGSELAGTFENCQFCSLDEDELEGLNFVPASLARALDALRADHDFLTAGGVFPKDLLDTWIDFKYENEVQQMRAFPHPLEFQLYYGV